MQHEQVSRPVIDGAGNLEAALALASRYKLNIGWEGGEEIWGKA